jgi:hypothetical protein
MDEENLVEILKERMARKLQERELERVGSTMGPEKQVGNLLLGLGSGFSAGLTGDGNTAKDVLGIYNREDNARIKAIDKDDGIADLMALYKVQQAGKLQKEMQEARDRMAGAKMASDEALLNKRLGASDAALDKRLKAQQDMLDKRLKAAANRPAGPGGVAGLPKVSATQSSAAGYARRLEQAEADMAGLAEGGYNRADRLEALSKALRPEALETEQQKLQEQAERNFVNSVLRRESGAAIAQSEFDNAAKQSAELTPIS